MSQNLSSLFTSVVFECLYKNSRRIAILIMDTDGRILQANEAFRIFFGYPDEDIIGNHLKLLFTEEDRQKNLPEKELLTVKKQGSANDNNYVVHKDGSRVWVAGESILIKNEREELFIVKIFQNIHKQKVLESGLLKTNSFVENILDHIHDLLIVVNATMKILKANQSFLMLCQLEKENVTTFRLPDLIHDDPGSHFYQMLETAFTLGISLNDTEVALRIMQGEQKTYLFNVIPITSDHQEDKTMLITLHDITFKKHTEQQREDILGLIAHELRNPLSNLSLCAELLQECILKDYKEEAEEYLEKTKANLNRLNKIINEMYDVTKAGAGHLRMERTVFPFEDMIREAVDTVKMLYPKYSVELKSVVHVMVYADKYRLIQVLTNYLNNAIKYSPEGDRVVIDVIREVNRVIVSVTDFGEGIASDKIPYLFNKYYRDKKTSKTEGVGLGLYLSREIIRAHQGEVWAESVEGKGATFYFSIPIDGAMVG